MAKICQVLSIGAFTLFCHVVHCIKGVLFSFFVTFVLLSCPRVCLLDVSRLLFLTLRLSALVCRYHQGLTRWRLAIAQEAARVFCVLSILLNNDVCLVISDSLRGMCIHAMLNEGLASRENFVFHTFFFPLPHAQFLAPNSGYAWRRSKCVTSWCFQCTLQRLVENESYELTKH